MGFCGCWPTPSKLQKQNAAFLDVVRVKAEKRNMSCNLDNQERTTRAPGVANTTSGAEAEDGMDGDGEEVLALSMADLPQSAGEQGIEPRAGAPSLKKKGNLSLCNSAFNLILNIPALMCPV